MTGLMFIVGLIVGASAVLLLDDYSRKMEIERQKERKALAQSRELRRLEIARLEREKNKSV